MMNCVKRAFWEKNYLCIKGLAFTNTGKILHSRFVYEKKDTKNATLVYCNFGVMGKGTSSV